MVLTILLDGKKNVYDELSEEMPGLNGSSSTKITPTDTGVSNSAAECLTSLGTAHSVGNAPVLILKKNKEIILKQKKIDDAHAKLNKYKSKSDEKIGCISFNLVKKIKKSALCKEEERLTKSLAKKKNELQLMTNEWLRKCVIEGSEITIKNLLGKGACGEVYEGELEGVRVAIKMAKHDPLEKVNVDLELEAKRHAAIPHHPNVVFCYGSRESDGHLEIVTEFCNGGELLKFLLEKGDTLTDAQRCQLMRDVAAGLAHLKVNRVIHRDLAARNVFLCVDEAQAEDSLYRYRAKIGDFGLSRSRGVDEGVMPNKIVGFQYKEQIQDGPLKWMSPEALWGMTSPASDVWSFGVVCWEILNNGRQPYENINLKEIAPQVSQQQLKPVIEHAKLGFTLNRCFVFDKGDRPSIESLLHFLDKQVKSVST